MNYAFNSEKTKKYPIEYICRDCSFTTFNQDEEKEHYQSGHYLSSKVRTDLEELI